MYHEHFDKVVAFASADQFRDELIRAKADYFARAGDVHDDERSFELRMAGFVDWYILDRPLEKWGMTPIRLFMDFEGARMTTPELAPYKDLTRTIHSLFEIRKVKEAEVRVADLADGKDHTVTDRRKLVGMEKGDLIEARLVPYRERIYFSKAFVFHPREVRKLVLGEVKRRKKVGEPVDREFAWTLSRMALKHERYHQVAVENIYRFDGKGI